jgi:hypothetical protein
VLGDGAGWLEVGWGVVVVVVGEEPGVGWLSEVREVEWRSMGWWWLHVGIYQQTENKNFFWSFHLGSC